VLDNEVLRMLLGPKRDEVTEVEEDYITKSFNPLNTELNPICQ